MIAKVTGKSVGLHGRRGLINKMSYYGTEADDTPSHDNPKKREYKQARADYHRTGDPGDLHIMYNDSIYLRRDIRTASNMKGKTKKDFVNQISKLMGGSKRQVSTYDFVVSPSEDDAIDPNNPYDVGRFTDYVRTWIGNTFNGKFVKRKTKSRKGYNRYRFVRDKGKGDRFAYLIDVQCDSHESSNVHAHVIVVNKNLYSGNGMNHLYYGWNHLKNGVSRATREYNNSHTQRQFSGVPEKNQSVKPTKVTKPIITALQKASTDRSITSRKKLIRKLSKYHVQAKHLNKTQKRRTDGWKFRYNGKRKHAWIKSSNLMKYKGAKRFSSKGIARLLSRHRKQNAKVRHAKRALTVRHKQAVRNPTVRNKSKAAKETFKNSMVLAYFARSQSERNKRIAKAGRWIHASPINLSSAYDFLDGSFEPQLSLIPKLSTEKVQKSTPRVSKTYQTRAFKDESTGLKEFQILSNEVGCTTNDKGIFSRMFGGLLKDWRKFKHSRGVYRLKRSIKRYWKHFDKSIHGWLHSHLSFTRHKSITRHVHIASSASSAKPTPAMSRFESLISIARKRTESMNEEYKHPYSARTSLSTANSARASSGGAKSHRPSASKAKRSSAEPLSVRDPLKSMAIERHEKTIRARRRYAKYHRNGPQGPTLGE